MTEAADEKGKSDERGDHGPGTIRVEGRERVRGGRCLRRGPACRTPEPDPRFDQTIPRSRFDELLEGPRALRDPFADPGVDRGRWLLQRVGLRDVPDHPQGCPANVLARP